VNGEPMIDAGANPARRSLGFDLARLLGDASFRARLRAIGHEGEVLVPILPGDSFAAFLERLDDHTDRCLLAFRDARAPHGWRLAWWHEPRATDAAY